MYTVLMDNLTIHDPSLNDSTHLLMDGIVTKQVNKADSFSFTIYPNNVGYQALDLMTSWITVYKDGEIIFHGRPLTEETGWNNEMTIVCEGDLAILNDTVRRPYSFSGTLGDYIRMLVNQHNAQVGSDKQITVRTIDNPTITLARRTGEYKSTMQELFEKVVDYFGGYIVMEYENGTRYLSYVTDSINGTGQTLEIGKNILDFQRAISSEALATAIIPLGATDEATGERLTIESVNSGDDYIVSADAATHGLIYTLYTWDDVTDPSDLLAKAQALLTDLVRVSPRIQLSAVDLSDAGYNIDSIGFFEYVTVQDTAHTVSGQYLITERTYNISAPENDTVTFGSEEKTISGQTAKAQTDLSTMTDSFINKAVEIVSYQTNLLKGGSGGYFIIGTDTDGHPSEIYFMDTDSVTTARSVLRINKNGIGFSTTGISGPYTNAWTIDGNLNASYITTGLLQDAAGKNSWNLDTGALSITDGSVNIETSSRDADQIKLRYTLNSNYDYETVLRASGLVSKNVAVAYGSDKREVSVSPLSVSGSDILSASGVGYSKGFQLLDGSLKLFGHSGTSASTTTIAMYCDASGVYGTGLTISRPAGEVNLSFDGCTFYNSSGTARLQIDGPSGVLYCNDMSGTAMTTLSSGALSLGGSGTSGAIYVKNASNSNRIVLNGSSGSISGVTTTLGGASLGAGSVQVTDASGTTTISLTGSSGAISGASLNVTGQVNALGGVLKNFLYIGGSSTYDGYLQLTNSGDTGTIKMYGSGGAITAGALTLGGTATGAGNIKINRADGTNGIELNPSLQGMFIKGSNGTSYLAAYANDGIYYYNTSGAQTAFYPNTGLTYTSGTAITSSVPSGTDTAVRSITLSAGKYLIFAHVAYPSNATGRRYTGISTSSTSTISGAVASDSRLPISDGQTRFTMCGYAAPTASTTYYLVCYQNSGSAETMALYNLYAVKLP